MEFAKYKNQPQGKWGLTHVRYRAAKEISVLLRFILATGVLVAALGSVLLIITIAAAVAKQLAPMFGRF